MNFQLSTVIVRKNFSSIISIIDAQVNMVNSQAVPAARMFLTTTLAVVMFTVFAQVFILYVNKNCNNNHTQTKYPCCCHGLCMCTGCCCFCCCLLATIYDPNNYPCHCLMWLLLTCYP